MARVFARVAVDGVPPEADRLYDYALTPQQEGLILPGMRVIVPFGRGNRRHEAMVVELAASTQHDSVKNVESRIDETPVLDENLLRLASHMRARLGCCFYDIVHAMLPAGLWYRRETRYVLKNPDAEPADEQEKAVLQVLSALPDAAESALLRVSDAQTLDKLVRRGVLSKDASFTPAAREKKVSAYRLTAEGLAYDPDAFAASRSPARHAVLEFLKRSGMADAKEISYYTGASGSVLAALVKAGLVEKTEKRVYRRPDVGVWQPVDITLNEEQQTAVEGLCRLSDVNSAQTALLFGVTGSGKTEVYINLIHHTLDKGAQALILVPEIALTPQLTARFVHEFGGRVAVLHSALALGERYDEWSRIRQGAVDVVVGTRSAVFAPLGNLKLIIIDEEHEPTFSSDVDPRYDARDIALFRARDNGALTVLGSATPSVDTAYQARTGRYAYFELTRRARDASMARVEISDRREAFRRGFKGEIGPELAARLAETLAKGEQAIFFLNRRGTCRSLRCLSCGHIPMCKNCASPLSYHRESERMLCHICGYSEPKPERCPACGQAYLERIGSGTQAVEQALLQAVPDIRVLRMDSATTQTADAHETILARFASGEADVL
ncbi:MAG: primosomal protein N', partial [Oscillospiraceae bacterium]|nr:primosomal protein N' [Oscillospiraceae bacterium]